MRLLLDTNVLIAAFIARGNSSEVFNHCLSEHTIITSRWILRELEEKLSVKFHFLKADVKRVASLVKDNAEVAEPQDLGEKICRDADDDNIIAAALAGRARCIITGDNDLLDMGSFRGIRMVSPTDFWKFEAENE